MRLWEGRSPTTYAADGVAALAETFTDERSGITTGAVAAVTAVARDVAAEVVDEHTVRLTLRPDTDGSFVTGRWPTGCAKPSPKLPKFRAVTRDGVEVMGWSATDEPAKNTQNVDLEPLMPDGVPQHADLVLGGDRAGGAFRWSVNPSGSPIPPYQESGVQPNQTGFYTEPWSLT